MCEIGIGVVGVGIRGRHAWENMLASHPRAQIRAVCQHPDATPEMLEGRTTQDARRYAEEHHADFVESFEDLLRRHDIHIVSLMTEASLTPPYAIAAARAGKHLVCDKPIATSVADAEAMVVAAEKAGVKTLVTFSVRYWPAIRHILEQVRSGAIGSPLTISFHYCPGQGPLSGFTATSVYRQCALGGELSNFGCYAVDVLISLVNAPIVSVFALTGQYFYPDYVSAGMEDLGQISMQFQNGVIGTVLAARLPGQQDTLINLEITGERGGLRATDNADSIRLDGIICNQIRMENDAARTLAHEFVECVLTDTPSPIPFRFGLDNLRVLEAAYRSAALGSPVTLLSNE